MTYNIYWGGPLTETNVHLAGLDPVLRKFLLPEDMVTTFNIPVILLGSMVNAITPSTIPLIVARSEMLHGIDNLKRLAIYYKFDSFTSLLERFIGVSTNGPLVSNKEWADAHMPVVTKTTIVAELKKLSKPPAAKVA